MSAVVWFNGRLVTGAALAVDASERGLLLGDGLFETLAVFNREAVWLNEHLDRLTSGADALGLAAGRARIQAAVADVLAAAGFAHGILRITLTRGPSARGLATDGNSPSLLVTLAPWTRGMVFADVTLATSTIRRNPASPASRFKTLSYVDNIVAAREAVAQGCDDALLLNHDGQIACTTIANIFVWKNGKLSTPRVGDGILPGIARLKLLALAGGEERAVSPTDLADADAVFLTNSLRLIRPVSSIDGTLIRRDTATLARFLDHLCQDIARKCGMDPRKADAL